MPAGEDTRDTVVGMCACVKAKIGATRTKSVHSAVDASDEKKNIASSKCKWKNFSPAELSGNVTIGGRDAPFHNIKSTTKRMQSTKNATLRNGADGIYVLRRSKKSANLCGNSGKSSQFRCTKMRYHRSVKAFPAHLRVRATPRALV